MRAAGGRAAALPFARLRKIPSFVQCARGREALGLRQCLFGILDAGANGLTRIAFQCALNTGNDDSDPKMVCAIGGMNTIPGLNSNDGAEVNDGRPP
jgi:hypothetical protein